MNRGNVTVSSQSLQHNYKAKQNFDSTNPHTHTHTNQSQHPRKPAPQNSTSTHGAPGLQPASLTPGNHQFQNRISNSPKQTRFRVHTRTSALLGGASCWAPSHRSGRPHPHSLIPKKTNVEWNPKVEWFLGTLKFAKKPRYNPHSSAPRHRPPNQQTISLKEGRKVVITVLTPTVTSLLTLRQPSQDGSVVCWTCLYTNRNMNFKKIIMHAPLKIIRTSLLLKLNILYTVCSLQAVINETNKMHF
jgi:hypothetical protein